MSENDKSLEKSLRKGESSRSIDYPRDSSKDDFYKRTSASRSPQKNTESRDYNPLDIFKKTQRAVEDSCIIADPYKPTMNIWVKKSRDKSPRDPKEEKIIDEINKRNEDIRKIM